MSKTDVLRIPDYLEHILEAIERIDRYLADTDEVAFLNDQKTQDAVVRNFEIIGEAAHNIERYHAAFAAAHPDVPWTAVYAMRNVFQHAGASSGYFMFQVQQQQRRLSYCVADQGCGIFQSLSTSIHKPASALDAITLAVRKGVTRNPQLNMGNGLWGATEIIARSKGQITISSGGAALYFNRATGQAESVPKGLVLDRTSPGTFIDAQIDASVEVQMTDMFDVLSCPVNLRIENLEDEDGAVRVPLKSMHFGAGTRQSGNIARVYTMNLLNQNVASIVIDFSDVGIVSSSFADEYIAKLYKQLGSEVFNQRIRLHGMSETNNVIIRSVLAQRIGGV